MVKNYWTLFYLTLIGTIIFTVAFILCLIFGKRLISGKQYGVLLLTVFSSMFLTLSVLCVFNFVPCCKDYKYASTNTYIEEKAKAVEFTYSRFDYDGNGRVQNSKPKFYLVERNEYIVLNAKDIELGATYIVRYYPNTKICDVIKKLNN